MVIYKVSVKSNADINLEGVKKVNEKMKAVVAERLPKPNF